MHSFHYEILHMQTVSNLPICAEIVDMEDHVNQNSEEARGNCIQGFFKRTNVGLRFPNSIMLEGCLRKQLTCRIGCATSCREIPMARNLISICNTPKI